MKSKKTSHRTHPVKRTIEREPIIEFDAKEFPHYPKNQFWYIGIGLLIIGLVTLTGRSHDYLLMLVVLAAGVAIFNLARVQPKTRSARLTVKGIYWGEDFYPYHQLRSFWISMTKNQPGLYLERLNFSPTLHLVVPANKLDLVVAFLSEFLPWHSHRTEPLTDRFNRLLRF